MFSSSVATDVCQDYAGSARATYIFYALLKPMYVILTKIFLDVVYHNKKQHSEKFVKMYVLFKCYILCIVTFMFLIIYYNFNYGNLIHFLQSSQENLGNFWLEQ